MVVSTPVSFCSLINARRITGTRIFPRYFTVVICRSYIRGVPVPLPFTDGKQIEGRRERKKELRSVRSVVFEESFRA